MKALNMDKLFKNLSLYMDGELAPAEARKVEEYIRTHADAMKQFESMGTIAGMMSRREQIRPNPNFLSMLTAKMEARDTYGEHIQSRRRTRLLPIAASACVTLLLAAGVIEIRRVFFTDRSEKNDREISAWETIFPVFRSIDRDRVFRFALFGILPFDDGSSTALRVAESRSDGYRIELSDAASTPASRVDVSELCRQVGATPAQKVSIDSILERGRERIQRSVFMTGNDGLAIDPEIIRLNSVIVYGISQSLEALQREKFEEFVHNQRRRFAPSVANMPVITAMLNAGPSIPSDHGAYSDEFIVLTPDSLTMKRLKIDAARVEGGVLRTAREAQRAARIDSLVRTLEIQRHRMHQPKVMVFSQNEDQPFFGPALDSLSVGMRLDSIPVITIRPFGPDSAALRAYRRVMKEFEKNRQQHEKRFREFELHSRWNLDSLMKQHRHEMELHQREFRNLDSVMRHVRVPRMDLDSLRLYSGREMRRADSIFRVTEKQRRSWQFKGDSLARALRERSFEMRRVDSVMRHYRVPHIDSLMRNAEREMRRADSVYSRLMRERPPSAFRYTVPPTPPRIWVTPPDSFMLPGGIDRQRLERIDSLLEHIGPRIDSLLKRLDERKTQETKNDAMETTTLQRLPALDDATPSHPCFSIRSTTLHSFSLKSFLKKAMSSSLSLRMSFVFASACSGVLIPGIIVDTSSKLAMKLSASDVFEIPYFTASGHAPSSASSASARISGVILNDR